MKLRDYQCDLIRRTLRRLGTDRRVVMQAPTGSGKTLMGLHIVSLALDKGMRVWWIAHQRELLDQTAGAAWKIGLQPGFIMAGRVMIDVPFHLVSVQTAVKRLDSFKPPDLIVIDEAHRAVASSYAHITEWAARAFVLGLTATPQRTDGKPLGTLFSAIEPGPAMRALISAGHLCDYRIVGVPTQMDASLLRKDSYGDFSAASVDAALKAGNVFGEAVPTWRRHAGDVPTVVMCRTVEHALAVAAQFTDAGIAATHIEGTSRRSERQRAIQDVASGNIRVIASVNLLIEGVDIPEIACVQFLRPTTSLIVWMQAIGRGLRPGDGKRLTVIDHVDNWRRLGLPDENREWDLGRAIDLQADAERGTMQCPACWHIDRPWKGACPRCGAEREIQVREIPEAVEADLEEIDLGEARRMRMREQARARTLRDLLAIGVERGYKRPVAWAIHVSCARERRSPTAADYVAADAALQEMKRH